ncbi:MAG: transposase [Cohaesibacter sp.]|nr:transposase [Cohaesibacter sp.]
MLKLTQYLPKKLTITPKKHPLNLGIEMRNSFLPVLAIILASSILSACSTRPKVKERCYIRVFENKPAIQVCEENGNIRFRELSEEDRKNLPPYIWAILKNPEKLENIPEQPKRLN